ncbi:MAG: phospho-sugar mutase [Cellulomonas sp.]|nr:phospho-sugar mutase [Cellulomonas sp.]
MADDPDPATARELSDLLAAWRSGDDDARADLADRFAAPLGFGTAGLRGPLGGGPARMNRAVVVRTAAGLAAYLDAELAGQAPPRVVVGYDARHGSHTFALDTAAVLTAAGARTDVLPGPLPTPVLAFAVRHLDADAGVMVTASHNPASDNGYKVYLGGRVTSDDGRGVQIAPPADAAVAHATAAVRSVASVPRADAGWTVLDPEIVHAYETAALRTLSHPVRDGPGGDGPVGDGAVGDGPVGYRAREGRTDSFVPRTERHPSPSDLGGLRIVLTAMHGVGADIASRVLRAAGFTDLHLVAEQARPDPDFPTVAFPNPEEPGALDLAFALAREVEADLVLALDPDADRCAVAVPDPRAGGWRRLHGDETGALLGADAATRAGEDAADRTGEDEATLACSIVSSRLLARVAAARHLGFSQTLTGFKWIARTPGLVFGYEEALGYCLAPEVVRDKDGITTALRVATLAADLRVAGRTLLDALDDLARTHGLYLTDQITAWLNDPTLMTRLRAAPPARLAGSPVTTCTDLAHGSQALPPTDGLWLHCADDTRVVVRPSGTEPRLKCYLEVVHPVPPDATYDALTTVRTAARAHLDAVTTDLRATLDLDPTPPGQR